MNNATQNQPVVEHYNQYVFVFDICYVGLFTFPIRKLQISFNSDTAHYSPRTEMIQ